MAKNILINFPTNIGDVILALAALDRVRSNFPDDNITAIASPKTRDFLVMNNLVNQVIVYDKSWKGAHKRRFVSDLKGKYDIMIDLKNSFLPVLLGVKKRTPFVRNFSNKVHIVDKYLKVIEKIAPSQSDRRSDFILSKDDELKWENLNLGKSVFIACTSLSRIKQYPQHLLTKIIEKIMLVHKVVILGKESENDFYGDTATQANVINLVGKTSMSDVFYLLKNHALVVIGVDSSITHLASYLNVPVIALFGPTSYERSYPRSKHSVILKRDDLECVPCESAACRIDNQCMEIPPERILKAFEDIINKKKDNEEASKDIDNKD
ncbi:MAG: glycosyltransferase family 9 protein [Candidatus Omnitrophica bacterium]|nr:glycosyltransferase family 9 protein [Candidatus Omnitrophota bacterium]